MILRILSPVVCGAFLLQGCAANRSHPNPLPSTERTMSFSIQTGRDTIVEATFDGTAVIRDGWISVIISKATLNFPPGPPDRWRSLTVRSFVAADYGRGTWKAPVESTPINVWRFMEFPRIAPTNRNRIEIILTDTLRFTVAIPPGASLATSRLGLEVEWVTLYNGYGQTESNVGFSAPLAPPS
jgi:hypothetical protein